MELIDITKSDIWNNSGESIYNYYLDENDFNSKFSIEELKSLHQHTCPICKNKFVRSKVINDGICDKCARQNNINSLPQCKDYTSKEYQDWYNTSIEANPACAPDGSIEKENWKKSTPTTYSKDSDQYKLWRESCPHLMRDGSIEKEMWRNSVIAHSPSCMDVDSEGYKRYYRNMISNSPQCKSKDSEEYREWYNINCSVSPSCKDPSSKEYKEWYSKMLSSLPQREEWWNNNTVCSKYQDWYKSTMNSLPNMQDPSSKEYKDWYKSTIDGNPACRNPSSKEYKGWYDRLPNTDTTSDRYKKWHENVTNSNPACKDKGSEEYQDWYNANTNGQLNKEWHRYSVDEQRLIGYNLDYVKRNEVGQDWLEYEYDDKIGHFYPDFKIQIGYGTNKDANWEWVEYKGDHLLSGVFDDQSHTTDKYRDCVDKCGFIPTSLSWLFELCIMNPDANSLWPNPRVLAYVIYHIWKDMDTLELNISDIDSVFEYIHSEYNSYV